MKTSVALLLPMLVMGGVSCGPTTDTLQAPFDITSSTSAGSSAPTGPTSVKGHPNLPSSGHRKFPTQVRLTPPFPPVGQAPLSVSP
jgi:hypothetical protein